MNTGELGPNVGLVPDADPADGLLDVVVLDAERRPELLAYFSERLRELAPAPPPPPPPRPRPIVPAPAPDAQLHVDDGLWPEDGSRGTGEIVVELGPALDLLIPHC